MKNLFLTDNRRYIAIGLFIMILAAWMQASATLDFAIQDILYNFKTQKWLLIDSDSEVKFEFYTLPKVFLISLSCGLILWATELPLSQRGRRIFAFIICMAGIPLVVSSLKTLTAIHCPYELQEYGGLVPFRSVFDFSQLSSLKSFSAGKCFPGGHASGGFAFMSSYFVLPEEFRTWGLIAGFCMGLYMGFYQMINGSHFLSHTLFTMGFAITVIATVNSIVIEKI